MAMLAVLTVIVLLCLAAPLYAHHIAHTDPFHSNLDGTTVVRRQDRSGDAAGVGRARPRRDADRPDVGSGALLPGRRQPGPRRRGPPAVRRPQLAADRCRRRTPHLPLRHADRPRCGLLRRSRRRRAVAAPRRRLGIPGVPVRDLPVDRPAHQQPPPRAVHPGGGESPAADRDHRDRLHPLRRAVGAGGGALPPPTGVHGGRGRARRVVVGACSGASSSRT